MRSLVTAFARAQTSGVLAKIWSSVLLARHFGSPMKVLNDVRHIAWKRFCRVRVWVSITGAAYVKYGFTYAYHRRYWFSNERSFT